mgnify:CR=1 FL=1
MKAVWIKTASTIWLGGWARRVSWTCSQWPLPPSSGRGFARSPLRGIRIQILGLSEKRDGLSYPSGNSDGRDCRSRCWATAPWSSAGRRVAVTSRTRRRRVILQRRPRRGHQLHRHVDRLWRERRAHRPLHRRSALRILSREQVRLPGGRPTGSARPDQPSRLHPRQHPGGRGAEPRRACGPTISTCSSSTSRRRGKALEEHGALEAVLELKRAGTVRLIGMSGTLPNLADHIAMGVFDVFQIPYSAVEREHESAHRGGSQGGSRHRHSGRRGQGRANRGQARRRAMGTVAAGAPRRPARRHVAHGVHLALHLHPSGPAHEHRRDDQSLPSPAQCRCLAARPIAGRRVRRS